MAGRKPGATVPRESLAEQIEPRPEPPPRREPHGMAAIRAGQEAAAAHARKATPQMFADWFASQFAYVEERRRTLGALQVKHLTQLAGPSDPKWRRWWREEAVFHYWEETWALLRKRMHILVCPTHGIEGVLPDSEGRVRRPSSLTPEEWFEALSLNGLNEGQGALEYTRWCSACSGLSAYGERLYAHHGAINAADYRSEAFPANFTLSSAYGERLYAHHGAINAADLSLGGVSGQFHALSAPGGENMSMPSGKAGELEASK